MTYTPRPGSTPARAIAVLKAMPPKSELTTLRLAEAAKFDPKQATPLLMTALAAGLLKRRLLDPGAWHSTTFWSLGDGVPIAAPTKAPLRSMFDISPAHRYEAKPVEGSFMAAWRRLRGETS